MDGLTNQTDRVRRNEAVMVGRREGKGYAELILVCLKKRGRGFETSKGAERERGERGGEGKRLS